MCAYNNPLADAAEELLSSSWGTSLTDVPRSELVPFLRNVRLPAMKAYSADQVNLCIYLFVHYVFYAQYIYIYYIIMGT